MRLLNSRMTRCVVHEQREARMDVYYLSTLMLRGSKEDVGMNRDDNDDGEEGFKPKSDDDGEEEQNADGE